MQGEDLGDLLALALYSLIERGMPPAIERIYFCTTVDEELGNLPSVFYGCDVQGGAEIIVHDE